VYLNLALLVCNRMLYETMKTLFNFSLVTFAQVERELRNKGIDPDFGCRYTETNKSRRLTEPIQENLSLANNYDDFISDSPQSSKPAKNSAMMAKSDTGNLCTNKFCNLFGKAKHSQKDCWEQHREKAPEHYYEFLNAADKLKGATKTYKNKGNGTNSVMNSKYLTKEARQAIYSLKKRSLEMCTSLDSCPDEIVELQAMFNFAAADKANKMRMKKIQKQ
jgi:hypothetical protein